MLVKMPKEEEKNLGKLNDKNQAFTRVAKYRVYPDHLIALLFSPYGYDISTDEVYQRYQKQFEKLKARQRIQTYLSFLMDYQAAYKGNFVFVPENKGLNKMSRFIPQQFTIEAKGEKLWKNYNDKKFNLDINSEARAQINDIVQPVKEKKHIHKNPKTCLSEAEINQIKEILKKHYQGPEYEKTEKMVFEKIKEKYDAVIKTLDSKYQAMSFEISNHFQIFYDKSSKDSEKGKEELSNFVKSYIIKAFDLAEGAYDKTPKDALLSEKFYELKNLAPDVIAKRFENTAANLKMTETGGFKKFIDHIVGIFKTKSKVYDIQGMIKVLTDPQ